MHRPKTRWREVLHEVIFEADTPAGRAFDVALIWAILLSVAVVLLESMRGIRALYGEVLYLAEWFFTILFTVEYILRLISVGRPLRYAVSFFGVVDLMAVMPTYLGVLLPGAHYLLTIRILRLLRIFRILKLTEYLTEAHVLTTALKASRRKISVFLLAVLTLVVIVGALMYIIEGEANGYTDIPTSIYWAIVTLTTVGYGDISPQTPFGKVLACLVMIAGYGIIAVPTGIVTVELAQSAGKKITTQTCPQCAKEGHDTNAKHCKFCGAAL
ncbi:MAG: ion transporter [Desulfobacteraceae bacterium]|nr:MAG: ion transporter [Desulfobacteraceae bacterium]